MIAALLLAGAVPPCPAVAIGYGSDKIGMGWFTAEVTPVPDRPLGYRWTVTHAVALDGVEGRSVSFKVELADINERDVVVTARVNVAGLPEGCPVEYSGSATVGFHKIG